MILGGTSAVRRLVCFGHGRSRFTTDVLPFVIVGGIALAIAASLVLTRVFSSSRAGRHASHFLDAGDADMPPEQRAKHEQPSGRRRRRLTRGRNGPCAISS